MSTHVASQGRPIKSVQCSYYDNFLQEPTRSCNIRGSKWDNGRHRPYSTDPGRETIIASYVVDEDSAESLLVKNLVETFCAAMIVLVMSC